MSGNHFLTKLWTFHDWKTLMYKNGIRGKSSVEFSHEAPCLNRDS